MITEFGSDTLAGRIHSLKHISNPHYDIFKESDDNSVDANCLEKEISIFKHNNKTFLIIADDGDGIKNVETIITKKNDAKNKNGKIGGLYEGSFGIFFNNKLLHNSVRVYTKTKDKKLQLLNMKTKKMKEYINNKNNDGELVFCEANNHIITKYKKISNDNLDDIDILDYIEDDEYNILKSSKAPFTKKFLDNKNVDNFSGTIICYEFIDNPFKIDLINNEDEDYIYFVKEIRQLISTNYDNDKYILPNIFYNNKKILIKDIIKWIPDNYQKSQIIKIYIEKNNTNNGIISIYLEYNNKFYKLGDSTNHSLTKINSKNIDKNKLIHLSFDINLISKDDAVSQSKFYNCDWKHLNRPIINVDNNLLGIGNIRYNSTQNNRSNFGYYEKPNIRSSWRFKKKNTNILYDMFGIRSEKNNPDLCTCHKRINNLINWVILEIYTQITFWDRFLPDKKFTYTNFPKFQKLFIDGNKIKVSNEILKDLIEYTLEHIVNKDYTSNLFQKTEQAKKKKEEQKAKQEEEKVKAKQEEEKVKAKKEEEKVKAKKEEEKVKVKQENSDDSEDEITEVKRQKIPSTEKVMPSDKITYLRDLEYINKNIENPNISVDLCNKLNESFTNQLDELYKKPILCNLDFIQIRKDNDEEILKDIDRIKKNSSNIINKIILNINRIKYLIHYNNSKILGNAEQVPHASNIIKIINDIRLLIIQSK